MLNWNIFVFIRLSKPSWNKWEPTVELCCVLSPTRNPGRQGKSRRISTVEGLSSWYRWDLSSWYSRPLSGFCWTVLRAEPVSGFLPPGVQTAAPPRCGSVGTTPTCSTAGMTTQLPGNNQQTTIHFNCSVWNWLSDELADRAVSPACD